MFYQDQAIEPVGNSLSDFEIHRQIGLQPRPRQRVPAGRRVAAEGVRGHARRHEARHRLGRVQARKHVVYDCPTWDEWVEIKKEHGYAENDGGMPGSRTNGSGLDTKSGKIEFVARSASPELDPDSKERPPVAKWLHARRTAGISRRREDYPLT